MYWTLPKIIARVRQDISLPSAFQVTDAELTDRINDYYQNRLPTELQPGEFDTFYRFETVGAYVLALGDGVTKAFSGTLTTIPGVCGVGISDSVETFKSDESGNLMGTYGGTGSISYGSGAYSVVFNTEPVSGAQIGVYYDTYTIPDNVEDITNPVTVAGFPVQLFQDPALFWSRWPMYQPYYIGGAAPPIYLPSVPQEALIFDGRLTLRPVPDAKYLFEAAAIIKPTALSGTAGPLKEIWGPLIAHSVACEWLSAQGDEESFEITERDRQRALSDALAPQIGQEMQQRARGAW